MSATANAHSGSLAGDGTAKRILVVDDDAETRAGISSLLIGAGYAGGAGLPIAIFRQIGRVDTIVSASASARPVARAQPSCRSGRDPRWGMPG